MKKFFMLLGAMLLISGFANAASIYSYCAPDLGSLSPNGPGQILSGSITCTVPASLPAGDTLTSIEVYYVGDWDGGHDSGDTVDSVYTFTGTATFNSTNVANPYTCVIPGTGGSASQGCLGQGIASNLNLGDLYSSEISPSLSNTITLSVTATEVGSTYVNNIDYGAIVEFDYSYPAPEPASLMMVGGGIGLLGLSQLVGKYLKKKRS